MKQAALDMGIDEDPERRGGFGLHESTAMKADEWLTPPHILEALGIFDLDPCAPRERPWPTAEKHYSIIDNGLQRPWTGRVWLNPPYGREAVKWLQRLAQHGNGVALLFARTETGVFFPWIWDYATAFLFIKGRLTFHYSDGKRAEASGGAPSMLIAYGESNAECIKNCCIPGKFLRNE